MNKIENPWQQAIDDELVNAHLGVAQDGVTREEAKAELNKLIAWHIDVAKYFDSQAQRIAELEQAASINQEYVTEMHRINGMAISAGLEVPNPNSPYFSEHSAIAYLQRQSYEQGWKDGNNNVKLMDHKD